MAFWKRSAAKAVSPERLAAGREQLAAWMTAHSLPGRPAVTPDDLTGYVVTARDEWLVFSSPGRSNQTYLVSADTVYGYAPSHETLEIALGKARAEAAGRS